MIKDKEVHQLLLGSMCGDGCIAINKGGVTPNYSEHHSIEQKDYLLWKKSFLLDIQFFW